MGKNTTNALRAARIARLTTALLAQRTASKAVVYATAQQASNQAQYMHAVQQLAAQYGVPVPTTLSARSIATAQKHAPSAIQNPCAMVHTIAAQCNGVRSATLAACKAAGINPSTAATQYAAYRKAHLV